MNGEPVQVPVVDGALYAEVAGSGPPLVMLHSGTLSAGSWHEQLEFAASHTVIRYDARSHGRSSTAMVDHRPEEDLRALLDHFSIETASLVGSSMGGATAVTFALRYPERVRRMALLGPGIPPVDFRDPFVQRQHREQAAAIEARDAPRYVEAFLRLAVDGPRRQPHEVGAGLRERCREMAMETVLRHHTATGKILERDVLSELERIATPTLLLVGELESADLHRMVDTAARRMPNAQRVEVPGSGHMMNMEEPELVNELLRRHLVGETSPSGSA